ncbi:FecR family protein [Pedobacter sp. MC2016-24]|uniref:FecR family protein n=1 Tax=Pedobacter sp. MC2016-24 TaxID=2780090 RepID=UPI001880F3BB|nr:FecR family protein [Pedobacter sp. MC2016-24]MBE9601536.1 FecR family protein [Pedobacter sp. MC2016-24]
MEYLDFEIEDFLIDDTFQQYCLGSNPESTKFWRNWLNENPEKKVVADKARDMYFLLNGNLTSRSYKIHYDTFSLKLANHNHRQKNWFSLQLSKSKSTIASAAVVMIILFAGLLYCFYLPGKLQNQNLTVLSNKAGEKRTFTLPDGTIVILNNDSELSYQKSFNQKDRIVKLSGEAYFEVVHDKYKVFRVHTKMLEIKDLGTIFNVKAYPNDKYTEASLIEGSIELKVINSPSARVILKPKEKILVDNQSTTSANEHKNSKTNTPEAYKITTTTENPLVKTITEIDWVSSRLTFNDENFDSISKRLERWYGVKIIFENNAIKTYRFVGTFNNQNLIEVLNILKLSNDFNYRKEGNSIIIY